MVHVFNIQILEHWHIFAKFHKLYFVEDKEINSKSVIVVFLQTVRVWKICIFFSAYIQWKQKTGSHLHEQKAHLPVYLPLVINW